MRILFINYSFPGIFGPLLAGLAESGEHELYFVSSYSRQALTLPGVRHIRLATRESRARTTGQELEKMLAAGRQALRSFRLLADNGCVPDLVLASVSGGYAFFWDQAFPSACRISWLDSWKMPHPEDSDMRLVRHLVQNRQLLTSDLVVCLTAGQPSPCAHILKHCVDLPCAINTRFFAPASAAAGDVLAQTARDVIAVPLLQEQLARQDLARGLLQLLQTLPDKRLVLLCDSPASVAWGQQLSADAPHELAERVQAMGHVSVKKYCALLQLATALVLPPGSTVPVTLLLEAMRIQRRRSGGSRRCKKESRT